MFPRSPHNPTSEHVDEVHFAFLDGDPTPTLRNPQASPPQPSQQIQHLAGTSAPTTIIHLARLLAFLVLLGIIPSTIIFLVDISVHKIFEFRESIIQSHSPIAVLLFVLTGVSLCLFSTLVCHLCSTEAEGSGIPAMKSIMSGFYDKVKPALSLWALLAKTIGLVCAIGGGLPVGWEGPNVHISCIVAHHLSRLPPFRALRKDRALRMQIMACACAVGLASSFGTPIGGVLYALETTSSFYLVPTFWKCVLATLAGSLVYDMLYKTPLVEAFDNTSFGETPYTRAQLPAFMLLGALLGLLGAFFVRCVHFMYLLRKRRLPGTNRYVLLFVVGVIAALVQYPRFLFRLDPRQHINEFFSVENLARSQSEIAALVLIKFPLIVISIGLPVPAGVFIPCFLVGSGLGRLYGELIRFLFGADIIAGGYAVVGAAAFTAGVTRALSVAVVIFEVTGQLKHTVPTLAAVLISVIVANGINRSLYDALIIMKRLPYMPHMRRDRIPDQEVQHIMRTDVVSLRQTSVVREIQDALDTYPSFNSFPLVTKEGLFLGSARRRSLSNLISGAVVSAQPATSSAAPKDHQEEKRDPVTDNNDDQPADEADLSDIQSEDESRQQVLLEKQDVHQNIEVRLEPDLSPLIVTENTTLSQLHFMFVMLMPTHAYVLIGGELQGIVTRGDLVQSGTIPRRNPRPLTEMQSV